MNQTGLEPGNMQALMPVAELHRLALKRQDLKGVRSRS